MKKILTGLVLALAALTAQAQTFTVQNLQVNGVITGATAGIGLPSLATQAANTVVANVTSGSASPTAYAMPSCSTPTSALQYTSATGFTCLATNANTTGSTYTGQLVFNYPTAATSLGLTWTNSGSSRWIIQNDGAAETGSNAGSNWLLTSRTDAGAFLSSPIVVNRASGLTTLTSLAVSGAISPSQTTGILGTTTNNNASSGYVGEYLPASGSAVSLTSGSPSNIASLPLTAGDYDVSGVVQFVPAGTTTTATLFAEIGTATGCSTSTFDQTTVLRGINSSAGSGNTVPTPTVRITLASSSTIFLCGAAQFAISTMTANGLLRARRIR